MWPMRPNTFLLPLRGTLQERTQRLGILKANDNPHRLDHSRLPYILAYEGNGT